MARRETMYCNQCGERIPKAAFCNQCGAPVFRQVVYDFNPPQRSPQPQYRRLSSKSRIGYVLLGIFLGGFGVHNFYAGYIGRAVAQLLITLFSGMLTPFLCLPILLILAMFVWVLIEVCVVDRDADGYRFA